MKKLTKREIKLRNKIIDAIKEQGFIINPNVRPGNDEKEIYKKIQSKAKIEQLIAHKNFLLNETSLVSKYLRDGRDIDPTQISLELREVEPNSVEEILFKWWNFNWWSIPYQRPYGRQMRFIIWDTYHDTPFGLIGLQSPVLKMAVRDKALSIPNSKLDYWVNQSMHAQRLGALPPYNQLIGGKMVALSIASNEIRSFYKKKYRNRVSILMDRVLKPNLLFITTTSAFGKSSIYNRLIYKEQYIAKSLGYTKGSGTFHIPEEIYQEILKYLNSLGVETITCFGSGPSKRIKFISNALRRLDLTNFHYHNIKREFFLFPLVQNLNEVISRNEKPLFHDYSFEELFQFWKLRWGIPRSERDNSWMNFNAKDYLNSIECLTELKEENL